MLNFRKLKQDFASNMIKEGKKLFEEQRVISAKILHLDTKTLRISAQVLGQYKNAYESEIEIDRLECETIDSDCDCPYHYDCQHLAALLFYLESKLDEIVVDFSKETNLEKITENDEIDDSEKEQLLEVVKQAAKKDQKKKNLQQQRELLHEYALSSEVLSNSPFFLPEKQKEYQRAELIILFHFPEKKQNDFVEYQLALRLPSRSKPLQINQLKEFFEAIRYGENLSLSGKQYYFSMESFPEKEQQLLTVLLNQTHFPEKISSERLLKLGLLEPKVFGVLLAKAYEAGIVTMKEQGIPFPQEEDELPTLPCLFEETFESPIRFSAVSAGFHIGLEYIKPPHKKILLNPSYVLHQEPIQLEEVRAFECAEPGLLYQQIYYRFEENITHNHLKAAQALREVTIPEPLFGTLVESALPELAKYAEIGNKEVIEEFTTLPFTGTLEAICDLSFLDGELEANLQFKYDETIIPASSKKVSYDSVYSFVTEDGIIERNLIEENQITHELFQDFIFDPETEHFIAKSEKKIIEFMTDTIPKNQHRVTFNCPQNLLDLFIYDQTEYRLQLTHTSRMDQYQLQLEIKGALKGVHLDRLWDCVISKRAYLELDRRKKAKAGEGNRIPKILVLDLEKMSKLVQLFDELGIVTLQNHTLKCPLWSIASIDETNFEGLPVNITISEPLKEIRRQMLGQKELKFSPIPKEVHAELRKYQTEGVHWLERLRGMYLSGILADDMGLGKTLQAIAAITQNQKKKKTSTLVICPTSLLYNWKEELTKFAPSLKTTVIDGLPNVRKKLIEEKEEYDILITSYSLMQKDVEAYKEYAFSYLILDEAQHIKNRGTRNAKSVKMLQAEHRLILSGTPIENSLDELWSLFDFLMPGFLNSYDRFVEKYVRIGGKEQAENLEYLKKKVSPFILRRMKNDVLKDLPPVSENLYHCQLTPIQKELYRSYAESARDELTKLVERDGFDKVQIHVLATLTRLKQICCHPAIFAKEKVEMGDSAKYDMLVELLQTLIEGKHKTVIFSQYTKMLEIMRQDFEQRGIRFGYLDGSTKNRMDVVKQFNEDESQSVFLVSLKAGGTGLNLVGADSVIHYDMWWNPAVENQATDRVYRIGQKKTVSVYKLVTLGTIEEKIVEMQKRKKGIVKKIVSCDDEAITKLTWEDVLELLQT